MCKTWRGRAREVFSWEYKSIMNDELSYEDLLDLADDILVMVNGYTGNIDLLRYDSLRHDIADMLKSFMN